jgi:2-dehydro-3-deoxygalactonokinase
MTTSLVAVDWGTTNCRAFRIGAGGQILEKRANAMGILAVKNANFPGALADLARDWIDTPAAPPVLMCGMIGSAQGWVEAPYVPLPAGLDELGAHLATAPDPRRAIHVVPGLRGMGAAGPDVMRGEETQIVGTGIADGVICLPGTHSKWAVIEGGRIVRFITFMTGEVFSILRRNSILGRLMVEAPHDPAAFARGLVRCQAAGGLLHQLFTVRTAGLLEGLSKEAAPSFLSGLLIGHEMAAVKEQLAPKSATVVGAGALAQNYAIAMNVAGIEAGFVPGEDASARGLYAVARAAGLVR